MKHKAIKQVIVVIAMVASLHMSSYAQDPDSVSKFADSLSATITNIGQNPSVPLQLATGTAAFIGCWYALDGKSLLEGEAQGSAFPLLMPVLVGGIIGGVGELTSSKSGTYLASIGGALIGYFIGGGFYSLLKKAGASDFLKFTALVIPSVSLSTFLFNASLSSDEHSNDKTLLLFPSISDSNIALNAILQF